GDTASFFCNISKANFPQFDYSLNWYKKINATCTQKIAEFNGNEHKIQKKKFTLINHTSTVEIKILDLTKNDSGEYFCGLIAFSSPSKVVESNLSQLTVTNEQTGLFQRQYNEPACTRVYHSPLLEGLRAPSLPVIIGLIIAGAVLLGLITYILFITTRRTGGASWQGERGPDRLLPFPSGAAVVTTYTVDYGVLEFQQDEHTEALVESYPPENTEYAVIVFPEEKPRSPADGSGARLCFSFCLSSLYSFLGGFRTGRLGGSICTICTRCARLYASP
uniref:Ig-like domain-containing protein n=1 Tax=Terrapene triunguis TaxID=2587831 RepID=A0A674I3K9_9SAUR